MKAHTSNHHRTVYRLISLAFILSVVLVAVGGVVGLLGHPAAMLSVVLAGIVLLAISFVSALLVAARPAVVVSGKKSRATTADAGDAIGNFIEILLYAFFIR